MNARRHLLAPAAIVLLGLAIAPAPARAVVPDALDTYRIDVTPQSDGMLAMSYTLTNYHVMSDWPSDQPYLQIGVPNTNFSITSWGGSGTVDVSKTEALNSWGSWVQFDFGTLPKTGDVFSLHFTINQGGMAYQDTASNDVDYNFIPSGWNFPITVSQLVVTWANPVTPSQLKVAQPEPTNGDIAMTWQWSNPTSNSSGMFTVNSVQLTYDASAFTLSDAAIAASDYGNGGYANNGNSGTDYGDNGSGSGGDFTGVVIFIFVVIVVISWIYQYANDGYRGGPGYGGRVFIHGGLGGGGGGGSHCACACAGCACACACACAGGGRVGCSRKAIGIECLSRAIAAAISGRPFGTVDPDAPMDSDRNES